MSFGFGFGFGFGAGAGTGGGVPPVPATVPDQTLTFGALTLAGAGGAKPVDGSDTEVALTSYDSLVSGSLGSHTAVVSNGRLSFTGGQGAPAGAVLRCSYAGGSVDLTIAEESSVYSVLPNQAEISAAEADHRANATGAQTIKVRRGTATDMVSGTDGNNNGTAGAFAQHDYTSKPLTLTSDDINNRTVFKDWGISIRETKFLTISYIEIDNDISGKTQIYDWNQSATSDITIDHVHAHGTPIGRFTDFSVTGYTGSDSNILLVRTSNLVFTNNHVHDGYRPMVVNYSGSMLIEGNYIHDGYFDIGFGAGGINPDGPELKIIRNNVFSHVIGIKGDGGDSGIHPDLWQIFANNDSNNPGPSTITNLIFENNIIFTGNTRASDPQTGGPVQGAFWTDTLIKNSRVRRNVIMTHDVTHGISIGTSENNVVRENTVVSYGIDQGATGGAIYLGYDNPESRTVGVQDAIRNIHSGVISVRPDNEGLVRHLDDNIRVSSDGAGMTENVNVVLTGPTFRPDTKDEVFALLAAASGQLADTMNAGALDTNGNFRTGADVPAVMRQPVLTRPTDNEVVATFDTNNVANGGDVVWDGDSSITGFKLEWSSDNGANWIDVPSPVSPQSISVSPTEAIKVRIRAVNAIGEGANPRLEDAPHIVPSTFNNILGTAIDGGFKSSSTITLPGNGSATDQIVVVINVTEDTNTVTAPSNFTLLHSESSSLLHWTGNVYAWDGTGTRPLSPTFTTPGANNVILIGFELSGSSIGANGFNSDAASGPSLTSTGAASTIVDVYSTDSKTSPWTWTNPKPVDPPLPAQEAQYQPTSGNWGQAFIHIRKGPAGSGQTIPACSGSTNDDPSFIGSVEIVV